MWTDPAPHTSKFASVNGIRMNYLDWGGSGTPLVLVHGFGDNPHALDDLVPAFTPRFRVVVYARRGHGLSEARPPYDGATLAADLIGLLDELRLDSAHLAGVSMGGGELTAVAGTHPDRVKRLVYLDAGYDFSDPAFRAALNNYPAETEPPAAAMAAWPAFLDWHHVHMFPALDRIARFEAYLRELAVERPDGSLAIRMDPAAIRGLWGTLLSDPRDYTRIRAPALAIFATSFVDLEHGTDEARARSRQWEDALFVPFRQRSIERLQRELPGVEIVRVPGSHSEFGIVSRSAVATAVNRFLSD
jgi:pimeloyl-ACP methyl ester carboxylesterase